MAIKVSRDLMNLVRIQELLDEAYEHYFGNSDGYAKRSEGSIILHFNNYYERKAGWPLQAVQVEIYSYVLGPQRSHFFESSDEALTEVRKWHRQEMSREYEEDV